MPPSKQPIKNQKASNCYKQGLLPQQVLPSYVKQQPREGKPIKIPEINNNQVQHMNLFEEFPKIEEWPGDDQAKNFDFNLNSQSHFQDQQCHPLKLTQSFTQDISNIIFWRRPIEYIQSELQEVAHIQNKYTFKRRQSYLQNLSNNSSDNQQHNKQEYSISPQKIKIVQEDQRAEIKIFELYQREETAEEIEIRKKEILIEKERQEMQKKGPKKGPSTMKKEEIIEYNPIKINDIKLSNMDLSINYPSDSKWIASQLQIIKDRNIYDCYTNKPIWTKIYPQQCGLPVYNNSGRYWVKLYYMGKERKIEIDDKMPINYKGECLFPRSVKKEEIWSCIFSKAIFKLIQISFDLSNFKTLTGSGFIMYCLTGLLSQSIPLGVQNSNDIIKVQLREMLSDKHYIKQDVYVTCYSNYQYENDKQKDQKQKQTIQEQQIFEQQQIQMQQQFEEQNIDNNNEFFMRKKHQTYSSRAQTQIIDQIINYEDNQKIEDEENYNNNNIQEKRKNPAMSLFQSVSQKLNITKNQEKPTYVIPGYSYPIIESFHNDQFNMVYVQKRSDKEIKLRQEYIELSNMPVNKMNKDQKIEHRKKKKEIKDKIVEEDKKRIELITHQPIQYNFFRIKTGVSKVPLLNMFSPFSFEEIHTAKTCIKNRLHKPPNYQDGAEIRDDGKSIMSTIQKNNAEESLQMKPLDDFSSLANIIESLNRGIGGIWISDNDILKNFEHIQLFYNPNKYPHNKIINVGQSSEYELTIGEEYEVLIIDQNLNNNNEQNDFNEENEENNVLFSFSSKECKNQKIIPQPYCILQKFDFQNFQVVHEYQPIRGNQNSQLIQIENKNQIFKILCYTPVSYTLNISSSNPFRLCSMLQFLQEFEGFQVKNFTIEYPAFEKNKFVVLFKFGISQCVQEEVFILKLKSQNDQLLKYMHLKLIENDQKNDSQMLNTIEGVDKNLYENTLQISNYMRIQIKAKTSYFLILEGELPHNVSEGNVQVEFYTKNNDIQFENYEHVEPLVYQEKYFPTKYGILFREKLYVQEDTLVSLRLKIGEVLGNNNNIQQQSIDPKKKGKINNINEQTEIQERDLVEKRLIKMELFENGKSIIYSNGYNVTHFSNVFLKSTKNNENVQYLIQAIFDLRDWPNAKYINEDTENIFWFLSVISTSTVAFVKDTDKEDKDKTIKKSWEDKEQGRAEKAKKARKKYEILIKKQQNPNIELTEEEQQLIQEVRLSKKQREEQQQSIGNIGKKQVKKEDKKNTKGQKKEDIIDDKKEIKQFPKSNDHQTQDICEFLQHLEQPRIIEKLADHGGLIDIRSSQNKQEIKENALLSLEEFTGFNQRNELLNNELKQLQNEEYQKIMSLYQQDRTNFKQNWVSFLEQRDEFKTKNQVKNSKEKELIEVLKQEKPQVNVTDFEKLLVDIQEINDFNVQLVNLGKLVLKNLKIQVLSNKIEECLGIFNVDLLKECMSEYKNYQVQGINQEIIQKAEEMLEEARQNPNFVVEKQAEAKKAGKKGKK